MDYKKWFFDHRGMAFKNGCEEVYLSGIDGLYQAFKARLLDEMEQDKLDTIKREKESFDKFHGYSNNNVIK